MLSKIKIATLIALNTVIILMIAEAICRAVFPTDNTIRLKYSLDEPEMILPDKNMNHSYRRHPENGGDLITIETNSLGIRGKELTPKKDKRIVVYGDSNIEAVFSNIENTFCGRLEFYLNSIQDSTNYQVINSGVQGFGPDQSLLKFIKEIDILKPDIVVLQLFAENDFGDIIRNRIFRLGVDGSLLRDKAPEQDDPALTAYQQYLESRSPLHSILENSKLFTTIKRWQYEFDYRQKRYTPQPSNLQHLEKMLTKLDQQFEIYRHQLPRQDSQYDDFYDLDMVVTPDSNAAMTKKALMKAVIKKFEDIASTNSIKIFSFVQPSIYDLVYHDAFSLDPRYKRFTLSQQLNTIVEQLQIANFDLLPIFRQQNAEKLFFKKDDAHWNDRGQDLAAKHFAYFILNSKQVLDKFTQVKF